MAKMTKKDFQIQIAFLRREDQIRWEICDKYNCFDEPKMRARRLQINREAEQLRFDYAKKYADAYSIHLTGCFSDEDMETPYYDIDAALRKTFGKKVSTDSESGQFFSMCTATILPAMEEFLKARFPHLSYSVSNCMDDEQKLQSGRDNEIIFAPHVPAVDGCYDAQAILKKYKIADPVVVYVPVARDDALIADLMNEAVVLLTKTGLPPVDAYVRLASHMDLNLDIKITGKS